MGGIFRYYGTKNFYSSFSTPSTKGFKKAPKGWPDDSTIAHRAMNGPLGRPGLQKFSHTKIKRQWGALFFGLFLLGKNKNTKHYASMTAIIPAKNIPSKVPAPPMETIGALISSMSFK